MRRAVRWSAVALLAALGCGGTNPCKQGTLLVIATMDGAARTADSVEVSVSVGGAAPRTNMLAYDPGTSQGTIEVDFPNGYPVGQPATIALRATKAGVEVGTGSGSVALPSGCATLTIAVTGPGGGGGSGGSGGTGGGGGAGGGGGRGGGAGGSGGSVGGGAGGGGTGGTLGTGGGRGGSAGGGRGGSAGGGGGPDGRGGAGGATAGAGGRGGSTTTGGTGGGVIPTAGLIGLWELDGNGTDSSGNGNNGTVTGATATIDRFGNAGRALVFTGANGEAVTIANEAPFDLTAFTITAFVRIAPSNATRVIISKAMTTGFGNFTLQVNADNLGAAAGHLSWSHDSAMGNFSANASPAAITAGSYVHVAVTFDATTIRFYVDGAMTVLYASPPAPALNNAPVTIGRGVYNGFVGAIDSLRVYNRVLSAGEIAAISADR